MAGFARQRPSRPPRGSSEGHTSTTATPSPRATSPVRSTPPRRSSRRALERDEHDECDLLSFERVKLRGRAVEGRQCETRSLRADDGLGAGVGRDHGRGEGKGEDGGEKRSAGHPIFLVGRGDVVVVPTAMGEGFASRRFGRGPAVDVRHRGDLLHSRAVLPPEDAEGGVDSEFGRPLQGHTRRRTPWRSNRPVGRVPRACSSDAFRTVTSCRP